MMRKRKIDITDMAVTKYRGEEKKKEFRHGFILMYRGKDEETEINEEAVIVEQQLSNFMQVIKY